MMGGGCGASGVRMCSRLFARAHPCVCVCICDCLCGLRARTNALTSTFHKFNLLRKHTQRMAYSGLGEHNIHRHGAQNASQLAR